MRFERAAILTDLDGTLFNSRGEVSAEDRAAIRDFTERGGLFAVATGREPHNARRYLPELPINGPSIVLNGAAVYDFVRHRYLRTELIDKEAALDVLRYCQQQGLPLDQQVYTTDGIFYASPLDVADPGFLRIHQPTAYKYNSMCDAFGHYIYHVAYSSVKPNLVILHTGFFMPP